MKKIIKQITAITLFLLPSVVFAWQWLDLWQTPDQQAANLLHAGKAGEASKVFQNKDWQAVSLYRAGDYSQAFKKFSGKKTSDDQYNAGNAAAYLEHYQEALGSYDKAIAINPDNADAIANREIVKKIMEKKQQQEKNDSSSNNKKDDNKDAKNSKDNSNDSSSSAQNNHDKNDAAKNNNEKQNAQNNPQQNTSPPKQAENSSSTQNKQQDANKTEQKQGDNPVNQNAEAQPVNSNPQDPSTTLASGVQTHDEDGKQMLRRLGDDPGGLLRQKFLRDYMRRHSAGENPDQGEN